jgi:glutathione S-transferase
VKLYFAAGMSSLAARIGLEEAGLAFEPVPADIRAKVLADGVDYRSVNPVGSVPALVLDDGTLVTEIPAILQYLADRVPERGLAPPAGTLARTRLQSWLNFVATELHRYFTPILNPVFSAAIGETGKAAFRERIALRLAHLDRHLAANAYLLGDAYSVADAYAFTILRWVPRAGLDLAPYANLARYVALVAGRPAVKAALASEGIA